MANIDTDLRCYLTNSGIAAENNAIQLGRKLPIKEMVFGSGLLPDSEDPRNQTSMIKEERAVPCVMVTHDDNVTLLTFKGDVPVDVGGFNINEVAIRLEDGTIYGYARGAGDYKPTPEQGATELIRYVVDMYTTNVAVLECKVDLSSVYADYEDLQLVRVEAANNLQAHLDHENPHSQYPLLAVCQFAPYNPDRTYKTGETCTTESDGELKVWQMYAGPNLTCKGKDPADPLNRHEQWPNAPEPWWWVPYTGNTPGQMSGWLSDTIPEEAVLENEVDLNAKMYWRLAARWPELVSGVGDAAIINTRDILGRYVRTADGASYLLNQTHEDAIRNISGLFTTNNGWMFSGATGAFGRNGGYATNANATTLSGASTVSPSIDFDASRVVPTANQNQPVTTIENKIVFV